MTNREIIEELKCCGYSQVDIVIRTEKSQKHSTPTGMGFISTDCA